MYRTVSAFCLSLLSFLSCKGYADLDVASFEAALAADPGIQLLDVRTAEEYAGGHLALAANIDWMKEGFLESAGSQLSKDFPVFVYCRSGRRSAAAAAALSKQGYRVSNLLGGYLAWTEAGKKTTRHEVERFLTPGGAPVEVTLIKHGSLEIRYKGQSIQIDPVSRLGERATDYAAEFPKADFILVTHEHFDHFDRDAISALTGENTRLVTNGRCARMLGYGSVMANGDSAELAEDIHVEAVPAYNTTEGHLQFHPKGRDNGFVLTIGGLRLYIAGDTEDIPEMADIKDVDVAFLPVNQPYTMTPGQCIRAAKALSPRVLIPYHYGDTDLSSIPSALEGIDVRIRQMQ